MQRATSHTFLDVVENALGVAATSGEVCRLIKREVEDVADRLIDFYEAWTPPEPIANEVRVFTSDAYPRVWAWTQPGDPVPLPLLLPLLYVDVLVIEDRLPVSAYVLRGRNPGHVHWRAFQTRLAIATDSFGACRPLLADSSLILVPVDPLRYSRDTSAIDLSKEIWGAIGQDEGGYERTWHRLAELAEREIGLIGTDAFPEFAEFVGLDRRYDIRWGDIGPSLETSYGMRHGPGGTSTEIMPYTDPWRLTGDAVDALCTATVASARVLPGSVYSQATHRAMLTAIGSPRAGLDGDLTKVLPALASAELPMFTGVPVSALVAARRDDAAFAAWRSELRNAVRLVQHSPSEPGFAETARNVLEDTLMPTVRDLTKTSSLAGRMRSGSRQATMAFSIGAFAAVAFSDSAALPAIGAAGATSAAGLALRALFPDAQPGARAVLLSLIPKHRMPVRRGSDLTRG